MYECNLESDEQNDAAIQYGGSMRYGCRPPLAWTNVTISVDSAMTTEQP